MPAGTGGLPVLRFHVIPAGINDEGHLRQGKCEILGREPLLGILRVIVVIVQDKIAGPFKILQAAPVIPKDRKGVIPGDQGAEFFFTACMISSMARFIPAGFASSLCVISGSKLLETSAQTL